ncbi:hypothetical protein [Natrialba aegyptia]|uniref:GINS subunit domain-containing protein n=1 Tax=Natrialba aegyptia DSM 13077 TaxID=1227491 RepID=M0B2F1_9EURY|nr:hypothetical protein [Natrialba aegyptia]ELZ04413.1 hypothetical protein C480_12901 [Natrialba aegyptia DSM 13077]
MNLNELRSVQSKERKKDSLQNLRPSFYQEVGEYIAELEAERERAAERADDPFSSPEVGRLTDEIETANDVVEAIYERRMGKLVKQASLAAAGMAADDEGLTAEEAALFDDLVDRIKGNKARVLDVLEGSTQAQDTATDTDSATSREAGQDQGQDQDQRQRSNSPAPPTPPQEPASEDPVQRREANRGDDQVPESQSEQHSQNAPHTQQPPTSQSTPATPDSEPADAAGVSPADVMGGDAASATSSAGADTVETAETTDTANTAHAESAPQVNSSAAATETTEGPGEVTDTGIPEQHREGGSTEGGTGDDYDGIRSRSPSEAKADTDEATSESQVDRMTVKITQDIGSILGVDDREYTLVSDDIVTLPEANATPLLEREAAEPLE